MMMVFTKRETAYGNNGGTELASNLRGSTTQELVKTAIFFFPDGLSQHCGKYSL